MNDHTLVEINHYNPKLGSFKPKFQGKPADYYQLNNNDVATGLCSCCVVVIFFFFLSVGFFFWSHLATTSSLVLFCSILGVIFIPSFMVAAYWGSNNKLEIQEKLIKDALEKIINQKKRKGESEIEMKEMNHTEMFLNEKEDH